MDIQAEFKKLDDESKCIVFDALINLISLAKEELEGFETLNTDVADNYIKMENLIKENSVITFNLKSGIGDYFNNNSLKAKNNLDIKILKMKIQTLCKERKPFIKQCLVILESAFKIVTKPKEFAKLEKSKQ